MTDKHWVCLDLEVATSPDACRHCGKDLVEHTYAAGEACLRFEKIGWTAKADLGLSIGCYWSNQQQKILWFDTPSLEIVMGYFVDTQPLIVSYNGFQFDLPLMRGILRRKAETMAEEAAAIVVALCDNFKLLSAQGYDILQHLWDASPETKRVKGLNSLDAIARANGLGGKTGHGADAPRDWAARRYAKCLNYCSNDVYLTKSLFDMVLNGQLIKRVDGSSLLLSMPYLL